MLAHFCALTADDHSLACSRDVIAPYNQSVIARTNSLPYVLQTAVFTDDLAMEATKKATRIIRFTCPLPDRLATAN